MKPLTAFITFLLLTTSFSTLLIYKHRTYIADLRKAHALTHAMNEQLKLVESAAAPLVTYDRAWARLPDGTALFSFTDDEWTSMTSAWPATNNVIVFKQGKCVRASEQELERLFRDNATYRQTNTVLFLR